VPYKHKAKNVHEKVVPVEVVSLFGFAHAHGYVAQVKQEHRSINYNRRGS